MTNAYASRLGCRRCSTLPLFLALCAALGACGRSGEQPDEGEDAASRRAAEAAADSSAENAKAPTRTEMRNVDLRIAPGATFEELGLSSLERLGHCVGERLGALVGDLAVQGHVDLKPLRPRGLREALEVEAGEHLAQSQGDPAAVEDVGRWAWVEVEGQIQFRKVAGQEKYMPVLYVKSADQVRPTAARPDYGLD